MMHMSFWFGTKIGDFLFPGLVVNSSVSLLITCIVSGLLAFLFEWARYLQTIQKQKELLVRSRQLRTICMSRTSDDSNLLTSMDNSSSGYTLTPLDSIILITGDVSIWLTLLLFGYILMLVVMTYNTWIFFSLIIGSGLGYFVFGHKFVKINLENCRIIKETYCMRNCGETDIIVASNHDGESTPALETLKASTSICHNNENNLVILHNECGN